MLKGKEVLRKEIDNDTPSKKRNRCGKDKEVEDALLKWLYQMQTNLTDWKTLFINLIPESFCFTLFLFNTLFSLSSYVYMFIYTALES